GMPVPVVEGLEAVDVEQDQRQRGAAAVAAPPLALELGVELAAIGDAGQAVDQRQGGALPDLLVQAGAGERSRHLLGDLGEEGQLVVEGGEARALDVEDREVAALVADRHAQLRAYP